MTTTSMLVAPELEIESKFSKNYEPEVNHQSLYNDLSKKFIDTNDQVNKLGSNIIRVSPSSSKSMSNNVTASERKVGGSRKVVCEGEDCSKTPSYGFENDRRRRRCSQHKDEGMIYLKRRKCSQENCEKLSSYGRLGGPARFCLAHKSPEMVDLVNRRCEMEGCNRRPVFAMPGQKARMCSDHRIMNMMDVVNQRCVWGQCGQLACYGLPGERARCCATHRTDGMLKKKGRLNSSTNLMSSDCSKDSIMQQNYPPQMHPNNFQLFPNMNLNPSSSPFGNVEVKRPLGMLYNNDLGWPTPSPNDIVDPTSVGNSKYDSNQMMYHNSHLIPTSSPYPMLKGQQSYLNTSMPSQSNPYHVHNMRTAVAPQYSPSNLGSSNNISMMNDCMQHIRYQDQLRCGANAQNLNAHKTPVMYYNNNSDYRKMPNIQNSHGQGEYHWDHSSLINIYGMQPRNVGNNMLPLYISNMQGYHVPGNLQVDNKANLSPTHLQASSILAQKVNHHRLNSQQNMQFQAIQKQPKMTFENVNMINNNNLGAESNKTVAVKDESNVGVANMNSHNMSSDMGVPLMPPQIFSNSTILPSCSVLLEQIGGEDSNNRILKRKSSSEESLELSPRNKKSTMNFESEANQIYSS